MALNHSCDYDRLQPYFNCDQEEEPTDPQLQPPVPSEDIWKKFQLLPAPPPNLGLGYPQRITCEAQRSHSFPKPIILQDCMWSSSTANPPQQGLASRREPAGSQTPSGSQLQHSEASALKSIDPALIFPEVQKHSARAPNQNQPEAPPSSSSDCSTDSESDDEEDEEDEGTAPKGKAEKDCGPQLFVLKRRHIFTKQHNYAIPLSERHKQAATKSLKPRAKPAQ